MTNPSTEQVEAARAEYDRSEDMCAALVAAAGGTPQDSGLCGGCRDLGPHRNVPNCDFYEPPVQAVDAKLPAVTRVTLAARTGARSAEHWDYAGVELLVQDDGRTLKVLPLLGGGQ